MRGITRSQLIKEAINEKVRRIEESNVKKDIHDMREDISEVKKMITLLNEKIK